jgi:hypothetical protein
LYDVTTQITIGVLTLPLCVVLIRPRRPGKAVEHDQRDGANDRDEADEPPEPALAGVVQSPDRQADSPDGDDQIDDVLDRDGMGRVPDDGAYQIDDDGAEEEPPERGS